jgi:hypothetical protein
MNTERVGIVLTTWVSFTNEIFSLILLNCGWRLNISSVLSELRVRYLTLRLFVILDLASVFETNIPTYSNTVKNRLI